MTTELTDLEITAVALVDNPANPLATVELFKRDDTEPGEATTNEEAPVAADTEELTARVAELESERQALDTMTIDEIAALRGDDLTKFAKADEVEPEDVMKGVPADVRKRLEDAEARVAKMEADGRRKEFVAKAADYTHVGGADELGVALEQIDRLAPEAAPVIERAFKAANARIAESGLFAEFGAEGDGAETGVAKAEALIDKFVADGMPRHEAITKVFTENPDLYEPAK